MSASKKSQLRTIMQTAWFFVKGNIFATIAEAMKAAWARFKVVSKMKNGVAYFTYRKSNGELREAIGTKNEMNYDYTPKGGSEKKASKPDVIKYYDLTARGWRSFRIERLVCIN